jgi:hypothetical protein
MKGSYHSVWYCEVEIKLKMRKKWKVVQWCRSQVSFGEIYRKSGNTINSDKIGGMVKLKGPTNHTAQDILSKIQVISCFALFESTMENTLRLICFQLARSRILMSQIAHVRWSAKEASCYHCFICITKSLDLGETVDLNTTCFTYFGSAGYPGPIKESRETLQVLDQLKHGISFSVSE